MIRKPETIDAYIAAFPVQIQEILAQLRSAIQNAAPEATEAIKYAMPTFIFHGNLVHFAAFKNHIGFYPAPSGIVAFEKELSVYKRGKGSIQFPIKQPMPLDLIAEIVKIRMKQQLQKGES